MKLWRTLFSLTICLSFLATEKVKAQTVIIPGNAYAFQWSGDPDIGLYFSAANSRYEFRDLAGAAEWWCNPIVGHTYFRNRLGVGVTANSIGRIEANFGTSASGTSTVAARGALGPTNGYLGAQGGTDFDGVSTLDISGQEVGVLGISTGGSASDNSGIYGHSNGRGVYGEHSSSGFNASLGSSSYAIDAMGPSNLNGAVTIAGNTTATGSASFNISGFNTSTGPSPGGLTINNGALTTSFDGNEVQTYNSGTAGGTWYVNFFGGDVDMMDPLFNPNGNLIVHDVLYVQGSSNNVGIGTSTPGTILDVQGRNETDHLVHAEVNYVGTSDVRAFNGTSSPDSSGGYGYGGYFHGGYRGMRGDGYGGSYGGGVMGVYGVGFGTTGAGPRYGVYGTAGLGSVNYGIYASGDMAYTGTLTDVSDARFKQNVEDIQNASELIAQLQPRIYDMKIQEYNFMGFSEGQEYGFVAQELEKVLPLLVKDGAHPGPIGDDGRQNNPIEFKGVNYIGMIPVMVAAMQEQQEEIDAKDEAIEELEARVEELESLKEIVSRLERDLSACCTSSNNDMLPASASERASVSERASLGQNIPNPFTGTTIISYYIPKASSDATIVVTDLNGTIVKQFDVIGEGFGQIEFSNNILTAGNYFYSLQIDGKLIDTRQMSLVK